MSIGRRIALGFVFVYFLVGGLAHFFATDLEMRIMPPYLPSPRALVLLSGVLELLGAAGLLWSRTRTLAGCGLFALTIAVTPANVYMLQQREMFPAIPEWLLVARLPAQLLLLWLIWWSTRPTPRGVWR